ncbi:MAG: DUF6148 family protein [Lachnospiraceae bacterium]|nr:DUF6148 family protein [Lachnospiraceae bacterium]
MGAITLTVAKAHLEMWLKADEIVTTGQAYSIGDRQLTRANSNEIRTNIEYWSKKVTQIENLAKNKGRNRMYRIVPRDL